MLTCDMTASSTWTWRWTHSKKTPKGGSLALQQRRRARPRGCGCAKPPSTRRSLWTCRRPILPPRSFYRPRLRVNSRWPRTTFGRLLSLVRMFAIRAAREESGKCSLRKREAVRMVASVGLRRARREAAWSWGRLTRLPCWSCEWTTSMDKMKLRFLWSWLLFFFLGKLHKYVAWCCVYSSRL